MTPAEHNSRPFTLLEVVIAVAVLGLGMAAALSLISVANGRTYKAVEGWHRQHVASQAAEYFLLCGASSSIISDVFPYDDYTASCELVEPEGMPDSFEAPLTTGGCRLATYRIIVRNKETGRETELKIDKIVKEDAK